MPNVAANPDGSEPESSLCAKQMRGVRDNWSLAVLPGDRSLHDPSCRVSR